MTKQLNPLEHTAYHEAGHAVACYLLRRPFSYVTVVADEDTLGHVNLGKNYYKGFRPDVGETKRTRERIENHAMIFLAGAIAVGIASGQHRRAAARGADDDFNHAVDVVEYVAQGRAEAKAYVAWLWERTRNLLELPIHWSAVQALTAALIEHRRIGYRHARMIIGDAIHNYR